MAQSDTSVARLAAWAATADSSHPALTESAAAAFADTLACILAGRSDSATRAVLKGARATHGDGPAAVWSLGQTLSPAGAALVNGTAAHALDFDDNRLNVLENAFPVMRERDFRGTVFTVTYLADGKPPPHMKGYPAMGWPDLMQLRDAGWCVAPHTMRHLTLAGPNRKIKDLEEVREEMAGSLERIREVTCMDTPYFAYPEGCWDEEVEAIAKTLFKTARHWQTEETDPFPVATRETDPFRLVGINVAFDMTMERFRQIIDTAC